MLTEQMLTESDGMTTSSDGTATSSDGLELESTSNGLIVGLGVCIAVVVIVVIVLFRFRRFVPGVLAAIFNSGTNPTSLLIFCCWGDRF